MDFKDKFEGKSYATLANLPTTYSHLNGIDVEIIDREFRGWSKWFYKLKGRREWFNEGCLINGR